MTVRLGVGGSSVYWCEHEEGLLLLPFTAPSVFRTGERGRWESVGLE